MQPFNFDDHLEEIQSKVNKLLDLDGVKDKKGFTILEGFIASTIKPIIQQSMSLDGHAFIMVTVIAKTSGRVYQYSLQDMFPDEEVLK